MNEALTLHRYQAGDRDEVFGFIREVLGPVDGARTIEQWPWKFETNPFTPPEGPAIDFLRIGAKTVSLLAGFSLPMSMGGIEYPGSGRGAWIVHPDYRGRNLWQQVRSIRPTDPPVQIGWSRLPARVSVNVSFLSDAVRPLMRILDPGPLVAHFTRVRGLGSIASGLSKGARIATAFASRRNRQGMVVRLQSFDDRADSLWQRARRPDRAMVLRNHRYLNWRYCQRPDATYNLYAFERKGGLDGFLVARAGTYRGVRWGYLVDLLAPENYSEVLRALISTAVDDLREVGVAAVSCFATDPATRTALFRSGFFPAPQRNPIRFVRLVRRRDNLERFRALQPWYLTMGDGDLEMHP